MYPGKAKLQERLDTLNLKVSEGMVADALASSISAWQSITGWKPFLAGNESAKIVTHYGGAAILLPPGFALRSLGSIRYAGGTDSIDGTELYLGLPTQFDSYRSIDGYWSSGRYEITGVWGLVGTCPADVSAAILNRAVSALKSDSGSKGPITEEKVGDVSVKYGNFVTTDATKLALDEFEAVADRYKVWSI